jgi:hypothetical protein
MDVKPASERIFEPKEVDGIARRSRIDLWSPAEKAIGLAVERVEAMPADVRLTDAVVLLSEARKKVADYLEGVNESD